MLEKYTCPSCGESFEWDDESLDEYIGCPHCGDNLRSPNAPRFSPGTEIGDYIVQRRLGVGGMGEVYLAEQKSMKRPVALKVLQPDLVSDKSYLERFYREVRTLAQIEHPNIVKAIEAGYDGDICYFSMMFIKGNDLKRQLDQKGPLPEIDALYIILDVAGALKYVWNKHKLIHRDIKPANIIVTPEHEVKLMDLGISKTMAENRPSDLTIAGMMVGSPYYVSPEQAKAEKNIDWRADLYSLGATFYHLVAGQLPYDRENSMQIIAAHISDPIPDPRELNPAISSASAEIIRLMMEKQREDRFPSWDEAMVAIQAAIDKLTASTGAATAILSVAKAGAAPVDIPKRKAKGDVVDKIKQIPARKWFSDLRIRFAVLVGLLFLVFLMFFKVVSNSVAEAKRKRAEKHYNHALELIKKKPRTITEAQQVYNALRAAQMAGDPKYTALANKKINELKRHLGNLKRQRKRAGAIAAMNHLQERSSRLEQTGRFDDAIRLWKNFQNHGDYTSELGDAIAEKIRYLEMQRKKAENLKGGVE